MIPDVITPEQESNLIQHIKNELGHVKEQRFGKAERTKVLRYGYDYTQKLKKLDPIPYWLDGMLITVAVRIGKARMMNSVTINEYQPGHGISRHVDLPQFVPPVVILSLGGSAVMTLWVPSPTDQPIQQYLPPRSLEALFGPWPHSIDGSTIKETRYSIVFRERIL